MLVVEIKWNSECSFRCFEIVFFAQVIKNPKISSLISDIFTGETANLADAMQAIGGSLITDSRTGARYSDPARLLQEWGCLSTGTIHLWAATHVMTSAMSRALVPFDMTAIVPRSCDQDPYSVRRMQNDPISAWPYLGA